MEDDGFPNYKEYIGRYFRMLNPEAVYLSIRTKGHIYKILDVDQDTIYHRSRFTHVGVSLKGSNHMVNIKEMEEVDEVEYIAQLLEQS